MKTRIFLFALACMGIMPSMAQTARRFTIDGELTRDSLRYTPQAIKKVYLNLQVFL